MSKIRINDLARELEVKSKAILDLLTEVGVTEKKTHSSSLEDHEADKVRAHFRGSNEGHGSSKSARASHAGPEEIKTKIDLSHISKPGDVLKAIIGNKQPAAPPAPAALPRPVAPPPHEAKPAASFAPPAVKPSAPADPPPVAPAAPPPRMVTPASVAAQRPPLSPTGYSGCTATGSSRRHAANAAASSTDESDCRAARSACAASDERRSARRTAEYAASASSSASCQSGSAAGCCAPSATTGTANDRPANRPAPGVQGAADQAWNADCKSSRTGTSSSWSTNFSAAPSNRSGYTSADATGRASSHASYADRTRWCPSAWSRTRAAAPGPSRPGARPGGPARRPGQRYVPRGVKEGPMKGFVPPPRLSLSNEPLPITRNITITEGISVKDLAEKLEIRAKDLIARLLARGVFATINQTLDAELASDMARFFGAETECHHL